MTKLNISLIKEFIENNSNCKLLSTEYINNSSKIDIRCGCGNEFKTSFNSFKCKNKRYCDNCMNKKLNEKFSFSYEYVKNIIESESDCILISDKYENVEKKLSLQCKCGCIFETSFTNFKKCQKQCQKCGYAKGRILNSLGFQDVKDYILSEGCTLLSDTYINCDSKLKIKCSENHIFEMDFYHFKNRKQRCPKCYELKDKKGENSASWQGGKTDIHFYLRSKIKKWIEDSFKFYNYKCYITGKNGILVVHHIYPFHLILEETFLELNISIKPLISDYNSEEILKIEERFLEKHYKYGLGIPILKKIHTEFHKAYGFTNTTEEQLLHFRQNYNMDV